MLLSVSWIHIFFATVILMIPGLSIAANSGNQCLKLSICNAEKKTIGKEENQSGKVVKVADKKSKEVPKVSKYLNKIKTGQKVKGEDTALNYLMKSVTTGEYKIMDKIKSMASYLIALGIMLTFMGVYLSHDIRELPKVLTKAGIIAFLILGPVLSDMAYKMESSANQIFKEFTNPWAEKNSVISKFYNRIQGSINSTKKAAAIDKAESLADPEKQKALSELALDTSSTDNETISAPKDETNSEKASEADQTSAFKVAAQMLSVAGGSMTGLMVSFVKQALAPLLMGVVAFFLAIVGIIVAILSNIVYPILILYMYVLICIGLPLLLMPGFSSNLISSLELGFKVFFYPIILKFLVELFLSQITAPLYAFDASLNATTGNVNSLMSALGGARFALIGSLAFISAFFFFLKLAWSISSASTDTGSQMLATAVTKSSSVGGFATGILRGRLGK